MFVFVNLVEVIVVLVLVASSLVVVGCCSFVVATDRKCFEYLFGSTGASAKGGSIFSGNVLYVDTHG